MFKPLFALGTALLFLALPTHAQTPSPATPPKASPQGAPKAVQVAWVDIFDAKIVSQQGNTLTLSFDLHNGTGVQPDVRYKVELVKTLPNGAQVTAHTTVYDETLTLAENQTRQVHATYQAPTYLDGTYSVWIKAANANGLLLALGNAGQATFTKTEDVLTLDPSTCYLTLNAAGTEREGTTSRHTLAEGIDLEPEESLYLNCAVNNTLTTDTTFGATFLTKKRSVFGDTVASATSYELVTIPTHTTQLVSFLIPTQDVPQAYEVTATLTAGETPRSTPLQFHYVIRGASATTQNVTFDRDVYRKGDTATLHIFWTPSADSFAGARGNATELRAPTITVRVTDGSNNECGTAEAQQVTEQGGLLTVEVPIERDCMNPTAQTIVTAGGTVLDSSSFGVESITTLVPTSNTTLLVLAAVLLLLIVVVILVVMRRTHSTGTTTIIPPTPVILALLTAALFFARVGQVEAATFVVTGDTNMNQRISYGDVYGTVTVNLDKASYLPGEQITVTANIDDPQPTLGSSLAATINGVTNVFMHAGAIGSIVPNDPNTFLAESTPGTYAAHVSFGGSVITGQTTDAEDCGTGSGPTCITNITGSIDLPYTVAAAAVTAACGANATTYTDSVTAYPNTTSASFCSTGTPSPTTPAFPASGSSITWTCVGSGGGASASCTATRGAGVSCGTANGVPTATQPTTNLCTSGTASWTDTTATDGTYNWSCAGASGGTAVQCSAPKQATTPGACGSANGTCGSNATTYANSVTAYPSLTSTAFCSTGTADPTTPAFPAENASTNWTCTGTNGGTQATCTASRSTSTVLNGACGSENDATVSEKPTVDLCSVGTITWVDQTASDNTYNWECKGSGSGATTASCHAKKTGGEANGSCGTANGTRVTTKPTANLCNAGTLTWNDETATDGSFNWNCVGTGTTASCSATTQTEKGTYWCGDAQGGEFTTAPTTAHLCKSSATSGTVTNDTTTWRWTCSTATEYSNCSAEVKTGNR